MRRATLLLVTLLLMLGLMAGGALGMEPPAGPAQQHFGCVDGTDAPVGGHPGAAGIVDATHTVGALTGDPLPTAWNAVEHADPIELGGC